MRSCSANGLMRSSIANTPGFATSPSIATVLGRVFRLPARRAGSSLSVPYSYMLLLRVIDSSGVSSSCALYGPLLTFGSLAPSCAGRDNRPLDKAAAVYRLPAPSRRKRRRSAYTSGAVISEGKTSCREFILINIARPPLLSWGLVIRPHPCGAVARVSRHRAAILAGEVYRTYPQGGLDPTHIWTDGRASGDNRCVDQHTYGRMYEIAMDGRTVALRQYHRGRGRRRRQRDRLQGERHRHEGLSRLR